MSRASAAVLLVLALATATGCPESSPAGDLHLDAATPDPDARPVVDPDPDAPDASRDVTVPETIDASPPDAREPDAREPDAMPELPPFVSLRVVMAGPGPGSVLVEGSICAVSAGGSGFCQLSIARGETAQLRGWTGALHGFTGECEDSDPCQLLMDRDRVVRAVVGHGAVVRTNFFANPNVEVLSMLDVGGGDVIVGGSYVHTATLGANVELLDTGHDDRNAFVARVHVRTGIVAWQHVIGGGGDDTTAQLVTDGNLVYAGSVVRATPTSSPAAQADAFDLAGGQWQWLHRISPEAGGAVELTGLAIAADGLIVAGQVSGTASLETMGSVGGSSGSLHSAAATAANPFLVTLGPPLGRIVHQRVLASADLATVRVAADGEHVYLAGTHRAPIDLGAGPLDDATSTTAGKIYYAELAADGSVVWSQSAGGLVEGDVDSLLLTDGRLFVGGSMRGVMHLDHLSHHRVLVQEGPTTERFLIGLAAADADPLATEVSNFMGVPVAWREDKIITLRRTPAGARLQGWRSDFFFQPTWARTFHELDGVLAVAPGADTGWLVALPADDDLLVDGLSVANQAHAPRFFEVGL